MNQAMVWGGIALILLVAELLTGTYYILAWAFGAALGGVVALASGSSSVAGLVAAIAVLVGTMLAHRFRPRAKQEMHDVDIGQRVTVCGEVAGGMCRVEYRGTQWNAMVASGMERIAVGASAVIQAKQGSTLVIAVD